MMQLNRTKNRAQPDHQFHFVQPALLALALPAISQRASRLEEFQTRSGIVSKRTAGLVLEYLLGRGIGQASARGLYSFSKSDRVKLALLAIQNGNDIERISNCLSWQDFEAFASNLLKISGYVTECNLYFSKPSRMQIDVVGINRDSSLAIVIDCKHWKRNHLSSISLYARKQARRASDLLIHKKMISHAIPVVLTLHSMDIQFVDGIPLVPISKFNSFVRELPLYFDEIEVSTGKTKLD